VIAAAAILVFDLAGAQVNAWACAPARVKSMMTPTSRRGFLFGLALAVPVLAAVAAAPPVQLDPTIREFKLPADIPWRQGENGAASALLYGDPSKPGLYVQLLKRGPNQWSKPHSHPNDRYITVLEGTFWAGTGAGFDTERTVPLKPGTFMRDVANKVHFDGSKDDGLTVMFVGMGPSTSTPAEVTAAASGPVSVDPAAREIHRLDDIVWNQTETTSSVTLAGDPGKPGIYVQYLRRKPNQWSRPHSHPNDRFIMVMGGKMHIGTGPTFDKDNTVALPKGGFVRDVAQKVHFDGSKDDELWIQIAGIGPATSTASQPPK
jgi:quercetin dioxygenase-like cupin family protein